MSDWPMTTFTNWPVTCRNCGRQRYEHDAHGRCPQKAAGSASDEGSLDVERLARALRNIGQLDLVENAQWGYDALASSIAAEYARLRLTPRPSEPTDG